MRLSLVRRRGQGVGIALALVAACVPSNPCAAARMRLVRRASQAYVGRWRVTHGDTLTLPEMGDRFKLAELRLDTASVLFRTDCRFRGALLFARPHPETLAVTWTPAPDQALIYGWPAELGPFGGIGAALSGGGDSLHGALLFDSRLGIQVRPGMTAQFVAGRVPPQ